MMAVALTKEALWRRYQERQERFERLFVGAFDDDLLTAVKLPTLDVTKRPDGTFEIIDVRPLRNYAIEVAAQAAARILRVFLDTAYADAESAEDKIP